MSTRSPCKMTMLVTILLVAICISHANAVSFMFQSASKSVSEDSQGVSVCIVKRPDGQPLLQPVNVTLSTIDGTAKAPADYEGLVNKTLTFKGNDTTKCVNVTIKENNIIEAKETFFISLSTEELGVQIDPGRNICTVSITDNDPAVINYVKNLLSVPESAGYLPICMTKDSPSVIPLNISLHSNDVTAKAPKDYSSLSDQDVLTFAPDESLKCVNVTIKDNDVLESDKRFYVYMNVFHTGVTYKLFEGVIANDDNVTIGFSLNSMSVSEDVGHVTACLTKEGQAAIPVEVSLSTVNGTAKSPEDYVSISGSTVNFAANETKKCVNVTIKNDDVSELNEYFYLNLTTNQKGVVLRANRKTLKIVINNDDKENEEHKTLFILLVVAVILVGLLLVGVIIICVLMYRRIEQGKSSFNSTIK